MTVAHSETAPSGLRVARDDVTAFVKIVGRGSHEWVGALKAFSQQALDTGVRNIVIDLRECTGMDSTFMGMAAGLAQKLKRLGGTLYMTQWNEHTQYLLRTLGIDRVARLVMADELPTEWAERIRCGGAVTNLTTPEESCLERAENVLRAHEILVEVCDDNRAKFKDVLTYLREDVQRARCVQNGREAAI